MTALLLPTTFDRSAWIAPGEAILGRYTFIAQVAEGRLGAILRVSDASHDELAVKTIKPAIRITSTAEQLSTLMAVMAREAGLQATFHHPNIIDVVECSLDPRLGVCTVMEYAPLGNLRQRIREGCLDLAQSMQILDSLLSALIQMHTPSTLHPLGVAHLDMEPKNIVFGVGEVPKICDFHYARRITPEPVPADWIDANHPIDVRTDLLQAGWLFIEMISFRNPVILPKPLEDFINKLTASDPRQRFQSARAARQALEGIQ